MSSSSSPVSKTTAQSSSVASLVAGLSGGVVSTILLYPLDLVKVRLQVRETRGKPASAIRILGGIIKYEGIWGLYQGLTPAMAGSAFSWGGYFFFYDSIKREMRKSTTTTTTTTLGPLENFTAACTAGAIMVLFTNPLWLIKTRMQLQMKQTSKQFSEIKRPYNGMSDAAKTIVREEGVMALYKGAVPALMLVSHGGVQFVSYEWLRHHFHVSQNRDHHERGTTVLERFQMSLGYLTIGAVSKIIATTATYPIQVVKSRLQQRSEALELTEAGNVRVVKREYAGVIDCIRRIWIHEGPLGYFKGCIPNAIRVAPGAAITFVVYELVMDVMT